MGCTSCKTGGKGCKNNGSCGVNGCAKLHVFDWLSNIELPEGQREFDYVEIRFKNNRKAFYRNTKQLSLHEGDVVVVEGSPGYDVGVVSVKGELARIQAAKVNARLDFETKKILRKASEKDINIWIEAREQEANTRLEARKIIKQLELKMKLGDVEFQGDKGKAIFYYTADERVDFRELIKQLADRFKIRVEMKQIGSRQEAALLGGIGTCGRELCCSTWLTDFRSVSTTAAKYQQLSLNPQKLAGQCGKLKCCLNYELDMYMEACQDFPDTELRLKTKKGSARHFKSDIFKKVVWYISEHDPTTPVPLPLDRVLDIIRDNKKGVFPDSLKDFEVVNPQVKLDLGYQNAEGEDDLTRFDDKNKSNKNRRRKPNQKRTSGANKGQNQNSNQNNKQKQARSGNNSSAKPKQGQGNRKPKTQENQAKAKDKQNENKPNTGKSNNQRSNRRKPGGNNNPNNKQTGDSNQAKPQGQGNRKPQGNKNNRRPNKNQNQQNNNADKS